METEDIFKKISGLNMSGLILPLLDDATELAETKYRYI